MINAAIVKEQVKVLRHFYPRLSLTSASAMSRTLLILAFLFPLLCFLLVRFQDADFLLLLYEFLGQDPTIAFRGNVIWITGASSGIGEYLAYELAKYGSKLVLLARRKEELERVKEKCIAISSALHPSFKKDQDILVLPLDLSQFNTHEKLTEDVINHFGKVDILVNNAARASRSLVEKGSLEVDRTIMDINTIGTISLTKQVLPYMIQQQKGKIIVVSSALGKFAVPFGSSYTASKHALQGYFDTARLELAERNIGVQIICPGPVESNIEKVAFTEDINVEFKDTPIYDHVEKLKLEEKMPTERCAKLMVVSMVNNLDEVWISEHPVLFFYYLSQYFPNLFKWVMKTISPNYIAAQTL